MQIASNDIWDIVKKLSKLEKIRLIERLLNNLKLDDESFRDSSSWEEMYGIGKGVWQCDAQEYVNQIREDRV